MSTPPEAPGPAPNASRWSSLLIAGLVVLAGLSLMGIALAFSVSPPLPSAQQQLSMVVQTIPGTDHSYFAPGNITISSRSEVVLTIQNFDDKASPISPWAAVVTGVVGGTEKVTFAPGTKPVDVGSLAQNDVAHTFSISAGTTYDVNVPIPPASGPYSPSVVQVILYLNQPGTYTWWCSAPCGPLPMDVGGGMAGPITVT